MMIVLPILLLGCWNTEGRKIAEEEDVLLEMNDHWTQATAARDAVIEGDLKALHSQLDKLDRRLPVPGIAPELMPLQEALATRLRAARATTHIPGAAIELGRAMGTCGECHLQAKVQIDWAPPHPSAEPEASMKRHLYAADRMWLGILTGKPEPFREAARMLGTAPLSTPDVDKVPEPHDALQAEVRALALKLEKVEDATGRAEGYGQLLATCAACHQAWK